MYVNVVGDFTTLMVGVMARIFKALEADFFFRCAPQRGENEAERCAAVDSW